MDDAQKIAINSQILFFLQTNVKNVNVKAKPFTLYFSFFFFFLGVLKQLSQYSHSVNPPLNPM